MTKTSQKRQKMARNYLKKLIQWAEKAKNGFKCFKMHSNTYSPKRAKKCQKMLENGKKLQIIAKFQ